MYTNCREPHTKTVNVMMTVVKTQSVHCLMFRTFRYVAYTEFFVACHNSRESPLFSCDLCILGESVAVGSKFPCI
jgi:hypothetical protein